MTTKLSRKLLAIIASYFFYTSAFAQTTTVLNFTKNDATPWTNGIVEDGQGGSTDISGITLQIYNIIDNAGTKLDAPMKWYTNDGYLSSADHSFTAITEDFDSSLGSKGMAIKAKDNKTFNLNSFTWYDWGYSDGAIVAVEGYRNGIKTVTTSFVSNITEPGDVYNPVIINFSTPVNNVDEIRMTFPNGGRFPSINKISVTTNAVLPVSLVNFQAKRQNNGGVLLSWNTSSEHNNKQFIIKHSVDGNNFEVIGTLNSKGSAANKYIFDHANVDNGINYYQLLQEDNDGVFQSLAIKSVDAVFTPEISIYPNPTKDYAHIKFQSGVFNKASLLNSNGQTINTATVSSADTAIKFDLQNLIAGIYIIELKGETSRVVRKISKF
ncbi:MAG TPA: T9SS type A sorting domain-containing protein [Pelobium sp.]|nr:T9SS type A sorting domain-containing protein [Pelobium sp.]